MPRSSAQPRRDQSVISRVVEQVRDTTSSYMPSRHEEEMDVSGGGGEIETGGNDEF
ncbi:MAG TPA: hypothetical protein VER58_07990 [Thermoanaerobaculia bacterium]|nr:hypothetical protein [Thermoanaerobaculia bacterium]